MKLVVIIPTYNERPNIAKCIENIANECHAFKPDILVVDDNSPDGTAEIVEQIIAKNDSVHILKRPGKQGLGKAYIAGIKWAFENGYDAICQMDADHSHNPKYLPGMIERLNTADVVLGSRYVHGGGVIGWGLIRKVISRGGSLYARTILNVPIRDLTGGFNLWKTEVLRSIDLESMYSSGYSFLFELKYLAFKKGFRISEYPIVFEDRLHGKSKMSRSIIIEAMINVFKLRFSGIK